MHTAVLSGSAPEVTLLLLSCRCAGHKVTPKVTLVFLLLTLERALIMHNALK